MHKLEAEVWDAHNKAKKYLDNRAKDVDDLSKKQRNFVDCLLTCLLACSLAKARFIRRTSAASNTLKAVDNEMICFIIFFFELHLTRQKCDV